MSTSIDQAFIRQYEAEVKEAYQRMGSKLRNTVRNKSNIVGKSTTFQKVGKGEAGTKSRHGLVPVMNQDHTPIEVTLGDYYAGDWVDKLDEYKTNIDERKVIVNGGAYALGRKTDSLIIAQLDSANTYNTPVNLSAVVLGTFTGVFTAIGDRDVPVDDGDLYGVVSWQLWNKMLQIDEFKRADYVGTDELPYKGKGVVAKRWLGALWMPHSGLTIAANVRKNFLYHKTALGHASGPEVGTDITWHGDRAAHFVNNMMSQGAGLIDTIGVQQLLVTENA